MKSDIIYLQAEEGKIFFTFRNHKFESKEDECVGQENILMKPILVHEFIKVCKEHTVKRADNEKALVIKPEHSEYCMTVDIVEFSLRRMLNIEILLVHSAKALLT